MRSPLTLYWDNPGKFILTGIWFGLVSLLFLSLVPAAILGYSLLPWSGSLLLSLAFALILIPLLQKYGFLETERLLSATITHAVLGVVLLGLYLLIPPVLRLVFTDKHPDANETFFFFLLVAILIIRPLLTTIQTAVDRHILSQQPDYQSLLCDISRRIATSLYLPDLLQVVTEVLPERLMLTRVGLLLMEGEKHARLYPDNLKLCSGPWSESRLINLLRQGQQFYFCLPVPEDSQLTRELMVLRQAGFSLVYGLQGGSNFGGLLLLGGRTDGTVFTRRDVQVFSTLANQVNIAVENSRNYETLAESKGQLQLVYDKLVQAEKMAALGELTTVLAHELKNPLGIIRGSAQFLASGHRSPEMQEELLSYIMDEVDNLNLVISNLLGLARHKPPRFNPIDLRKELATFIYQWQQSSDHNSAVEIVLSVPDLMPSLYADSRQLRQVLLNCIANSEEVMPGGGTIKITVRELPGEHIEIIIADSGPGIAEEDLKLVFKKFFTTKEKGVGLGLPVCRQIIRAHNGSIRLQNQSGGGLEVNIRLPLRPLVSVGQGIYPADETKTILRRVWSNEY